MHKKILENLDEKYFSDILSKLLDTKKNHNYFANEFVKLLLPKWKDSGLNNSSVFREYALFFKDITKNIDLLFIDLDSTEEIVIGIENKFLTQDSKEQLQIYYQALHKQFDSYIPSHQVLLVYLTLDGRIPQNFSNDTISCLSWLEDIYTIVENIINRDKKNATVTQDLKKNVEELFVILNTIKTMTYKTLSLDPLKKQLLEILPANHWSDTIKKQQSYILKAKHKTDKNKVFKHKYIKISSDTKGYVLEYKNGFEEFKISLPFHTNYDQAKHLILLFCRKVGIENNREEFILKEDLKHTLHKKMTIDSKISSYLIYDEKDAN